MAPDVRAYFEPMVAVLPTLRSWWEELDADDGLGSSWAALAEAMVAHQADHRLPDLTALVPFLERALVERNAHDEVSLGFIETLLREAEAADLDTDWIRDTLGPTARADWEALYAQRHQMDRVALHWAVADLGSRADEPAELIRWVAEAGALVPAGGELAEIRVGGADCRLVLEFDAYLDQRVATDAQRLGLGFLVAYVLPARGAGRPRSRPAGRLVPNGQIGAAAV